MEDSLTTPQTTVTPASITSSTTGSGDITTESVLSWTTTGAISNSLVLCQGLTYHPTTPTEATEVMALIRPLHSILPRELDIGMPSQELPLLAAAER